MFNLLLTLHILAAGLWFGSSVAIGMIAARAKAAGADTLAAVTKPINGWAGKAHPAAGVVLLITGPGMVADLDLGFGEPWVMIALIGLIVLMGIGGALIGRTAGELEQQVGGGADQATITATADKLLAFVRLENVLLALVIIDMVVKPGS